MAAVEGAGGGKSALGCYWLLKMCLKYPGTRWLMGRSEMKTLKETTLNTFFEICGKQGLKSEVHYRYREHKSAIYFENGSEILLKDLFQYPSDPNFDSLGSLEISGAFIDECNQVVKKAWNIVKSRIRYKIDQYGIVPKMLGTCNPAKNFVFYDFYKPWKQNELPVGRKFIQSLVADNPNLSDFYRQNLLTLDNASRERLLFGNWEYDDDPALLVSYDKILETFSNSFVEAGKRYITADVARFGKDKTVIGVWNGLRIEKIVIIDSSGTNVVRETIQRLRNEYQIPLLNVIVDEDGVGCLVEGTKVLTDRGWINVEDVTKSDKVYSKDKNNNLVLASVISNEKREVTDIIVDKSGLSFSFSHFLPVRTRNEYPFKTQGWDVISHGKQYKFDTYSNWQGQDMEYVFSATKYRMPNGGLKTLNNELKIASIDFAAFLGWYVSEGCIDEDKYIKITQSNNSIYIDEIESVLDRCGFSWSISYHNGGSRNYVICQKQLVQWLKKNCYTNDRMKSYNKKVPDCIKISSKETIESFLHSFNQGDGHFHKGERMYNTSSYTLAHDLGELIYKVGKLFTIRKKQEKGSVSFIGKRKITRTKDCFLVSELRETGFGIIPKVAKIYEDHVFNLEIDSPTKLYMVLFEGKKPFFVHNGGVKDELGCRGFVNNASPIVTRKFEYNEEGHSVRNTENYRNLKSQCAFGLADWINRNQIYIQAESEQKEAIIEELGYLKKRAVDNDNKQEILRKDEIKEMLGRSPDYFDMLLMRKYFDLVKPQGGFIM